ncbi:MAG TPA: CoA transferase [Acidimicrobiales bacterium]|nr:CoA transferase [Acidimicrobiales bacterium]
MTNANGPLAGIKVVDLTRVLAGPYCTMVLGDLGADVVKVERPRGGDDSRHIGPFINGISAYFASLNRGKKSVALDLKEQPDRERFEAMLVDADVLVENFRPGTMEKLGYGWEGLHPRFPRLVYAAVSGFGHTGPLAKRPAYDMVVQAMGGVMSITGQPDGPPTRVGTSIGDVTAGLFTAIGICSALFERERTGEAAKIDVAMLDCQVAILENAIARYAATGEVPGPIGARHPSITPFAAFEARDGWFVIAAGNDMLFRRLCAVIDCPDVADDPRFATNALRTDHHAELQVELERALHAHTVDEWLARLEAADLPCGPINDVAAVLAHPQIRARNMVVTVEDDRLAGLEVAGNPIKNSLHPDALSRGRVPDLGQDPPSHE